MVPSLKNSTQRKGRDGLFEIKFSFLSLDIRVISYYLPLLYESFFYFLLNINFYNPDIQRLWQEIWGNICNP